MPTGYLDRALSLARELAGPTVLAGFATALCREGDVARGRDCLAEAARLLWGLPHPDVNALHEARLVAESAVGLAEEGYATEVARWATRAASGLGSPEAEDALVPVVAVAGLVGEGLALAERRSPPRAERLALVAREAAKRGDSSVARRGFERALEAARGLEGRDRGWRLRDVAQVMAEAGEHELLRVAVTEAMAVAAGERTMTTQLAVLLAQAGELKAAAAAVKRAPRPQRSALALAVAAGAHPLWADREALRRAAHEARAQALPLEDGRTRVWLLCDVAEALASIGDTSDAIDVLADVGGRLPPAGAAGFAAWLSTRFCRLAFAIGGADETTPLRRSADVQLRALELDVRAALETLQAAQSALEAARRAGGGEAGQLPDVGRWDGPLVAYVERCFGAALAWRQARRLEGAATLLCDGLECVLRGGVQVSRIVHLNAWSMLSRWGQP